MLRCLDRGDGNRRMDERTGGLMVSTAASIIALFALVGAVAVLWWDRALFASHPLGVAVQVAAVVLMIWARLTFGSRSFHAGANPTEGGIVTVGPYGFLRHPIYAAALWFTWSGVLSHLSALTVGMGLVVIAATAVRIATEEHLLRERYPEYAAYAARTRRVIPFVL
jgi:protein-S-isoprenylcysteine O-methyltransferase Ste14